MPDISRVITPANIMWAKCGIAVQAAQHQQKKRATKQQRTGSTAVLHSSNAMPLISFDSAAASNCSALTLLSEVHMHCWQACLNVGPFAIKQKDSVVQDCRPGDAENHQCHQLQETNQPAAQEQHSMECRKGSTGACMHQNLYVAYPAGPAWCMGASQHDICPPA
jgi:hypothetical protein